MPTRPTILALIATCGTLASCSSPFSTSDSDRGMNVGTERLRQVKPLDVSAMARPSAPAPATAPASRPEPPPKDPFAGLERVTVTIDQVRAWTLENNLDLKVVMIDPTIARTRLTEEEAKFESTFFANARYNSLDQPTASQLAGSQVESFDADLGVRVPLRTGGTATVELPVNRTKTDNQFSTLNPSVDTDARFSISQPLLRGGWREANTHSIRIAALDAQITQARTNLEVIRQLAEAERAYWRFYAFREALTVTQTQYELAKEQLERAERRVKSGAAPDIEVTRAESGLAQRLEAIIQAENNLKQAQRALKRTLNVNNTGVDSAAAIEPGTPPSPVDLALDPPALADGAVRDRMEMLELELRLAQDVSSVRFAENQALPSFLVDYAYNFNGLGQNFSESTTQLRGGDFADWTVGARFETPIGNMAARSRVQQAIITRLQRLATREARVLQIRQEVFNAVDSISAGWQRILATRQSTILAGRTLDAEQRQFDVGLRTSTDVLNAAANLADAQLAEIRALTEYQIGLIDLSFATGTLLGQSRVSWEPIDPRLDPTVPQTNPVAPATAP
ncbi:MAG: TolC family protein [Phycisphaerales bacterium]